MTTPARIGLAILTLIFTIALTYASVELPRLASRALMERLETPGFDPTYHPEETEVFIQSRHLRVVGRSVLMLTGLLILAGLIAEGRSADEIVAALSRLRGEIKKKLL